MLPKKLKQNLLEYTSQKYSQTLPLLLKLSPCLSSPSSPFCSPIDQTNEQLQHYLQCSLYDIIFNGTITDLCSLLKLLFVARQGNDGIGKKVVLGFLENVVECLCGGDLEEVVGVVLGEVGGLVAMVGVGGQGHGQGGVEINRLHRVVNQCLRKIQKTERNSVMRGKLHVLMTSILQLAHKSGLVQHSQQPPKLPIHIPSPTPTPPQPTLTPTPQQPQTLTAQQYLHNPFQIEQIPYTYYYTYCKIYKILNQNPYLHFPNKPGMYEGLGLERCFQQFFVEVKELGFCVKEIGKYFGMFPVVDMVYKQQYQIEYGQQHQNHSLTMQPIPLHFLHYHSNPQFRQILFTQLLLYCKLILNVSLKFLNTSQNTFTKIVNVVMEIQENVIRGIGKVVKNGGGGGKGKGEGQGQGQGEKMRDVEVVEDVGDVLEAVRVFWENQGKWGQIKYGDRKSVLCEIGPEGVKGLSKLDATNINEQSSQTNKTFLDLLQNLPSLSTPTSFPTPFSTSTPIPTPTPTTDTPNLPHPLNLTKTKITKFLNPNPSSFNLTTSPTTPSFSYFLEQAQQEFGKFGEDWRGGRFRSWGDGGKEGDKHGDREWAGLKWKGLRCLGRERLGEVVVGGFEEYEREWDKDQSRKRMKDPLPKRYHPVQVTRNAKYQQTSKKQLYSQTDTE